MIKSLKQLFIIIGFSILLIACKKENATENPVEFGFLSITNQTTAKSISLKRNNIPLIMTPAGLNNIKIPVGSGKFSFYDEAGQLLLDTTYKAELNKVTNWLLFQPLASVKPLILENNQTDEPKPQEGFIKVKAANFAKSIFQGPVDLVFSYPDLITGVYTPSDTLKNLTSGFDKYVSLNRFSSLNKRANLYIVDSKTKQRLHSRWYILDPIKNDFGIYTLYLVEDNNTGKAITGTTAKVDVKVLFSN